MSQNELDKLIEAEQQRELEYWEAINEWLQTVKRIVSKW